MKFSLHTIKLLCLIECGGNGKDIIPLLNICASSLESMEIERMNIEGLQTADTDMLKLKRLRIMDACNGSDGSNFAPFVNHCGTTLEQLEIVKTKIDQFNITSPIIGLRRLHIDLNKDEGFHVIKDLVIASITTLESIWWRGITLNDFNINDQSFEKLAHISLHHPSLFVSTGVKKLLLAASTSLKTLDCNVGTFLDLQFESTTFRNLSKIKLYTARETSVVTIQNLMMASSSSLQTLDLKNANLTGFEMAESSMLNLVKIKFQFVESELEDIRTLICVCNNLQLLYLRHRKVRPEFGVLRQENPDIRIGITPDKNSEAKDTTGEN